MTRGEMLKKLEQLTIWVEMTYMPSEFAVECQYITSEGTCEEWMSPDEWPAYKIYGVTEQLLDLIREKLHDNALDVSDLRGTNLLNFFNKFKQDDENLELSQFFAPLREIQSCEDDTLFAYTGGCGSIPQYYNDSESLKKQFAEDFEGEMTPWSDYSDEELEQTLAYMEATGDSFPYTYFGDEDET